MKFRDRSEAGKQLALKLAAYAGDANVLVLVLPRGGVRVLNDDVVNYLHISEGAIEKATQSEQRELERRERLYRGNRSSPDLQSKMVILVDDGLATGATMSAAVVPLRKQHPARIIVAAPVAVHTTCEAFEAMADDIVCLCDRTSEPFYAVGLWYDDFRQTTDTEVRDLLERANTSAALHHNRPLVA